MYIGYRFYVWNLMNFTLKCEAADRQARTLILDLYSHLYSLIYP